MAKPKTTNGSVNEDPVSLFFFSDRYEHTLCLPSVGVKENLDNGWTNLVGFSAINLGPAPQCGLTHWHH